MAEKKGLHPAIACAIMCVMLACALCMGANRGWTKERKSLDGEVSALNAALSARAETAYNLLTVAARHMDESDARLAQLRGDIKLLENASAPLAERAAASARYQPACKEILSALAALPGVQSDSRDVMYVIQMLPQAVEQCASQGAQQAYNEAAEAYNARMRKSFSGLLARLTGVDFAPSFAAVQEGGL